MICPEDAKQAFNIMKKKLTSAPILGFPTGRAMKCSGFTQMQVRIFSGDSYTRTKITSEHRRAL